MPRFILPFNTEALTCDTAIPVVTWPILQWRGTSICEMYWRRAWNAPPGVAVGGFRSRSNELTTIRAQYSPGGVLRGTDTITLTSWDSRGPRTNLCGNAL